MHRIASVLAAAILLAAAPALAMPHGKPGLWTITTTMQMANMPQLPPQVLEMMKKRGMPGMGQPVTSQMCMTQEQVNAGMASHMPQQHDVSCAPRVLSETPSSAVTEITCHGDNMDGVGRAQIDWRGDSHYEGSYEFKGSMHGQPNQISTHYAGDFVKADCGSVKPFAPPPQH